MVHQLLDKVATLQYTALSFIKKNGARVRPSCRSAESSNIFTGKCLWRRSFFTKDTSLEFIPAISLKRDARQHSSCPIWIFQDNYFQIIGKFSARYLCKTFFDKVAGFQSIGCDFIGNNVFDKTFQKQLLKNYIYIGMPMMPMLMPIPRCRCRDFQMAVTSRQTSISINYCTDSSKTFFPCEYR